MSGIESLGTALPGPGHAASDVAQAAATWLGGDQAQHDLFTRFSRSAMNERRYFALSFSEILELRGLEQRGSLFEQHAPGLGAEAVRNALQSARCPPEEVAAFVFSSCSVPVIPSVDTLIIDRAGLRSTVRRVPLYQQGCAGGMVGLSLAAALAEHEGPVVLCCVELCSLVFHHGDRSGAQLVGSAIFGDGAGAALVVPGAGRLKITSARSQLIPASRHLMGYDLRDDGTHLRLDRELPKALVQSLPGLVASFLSDNRMEAGDLSFWLVHPGGPKILDALEEALMLDDRQLHWSREVLRRFGNLSSASVLFVADLFLRESGIAPGSRGLLIGVGPGLTIEMLLLEVS